MLIPIGIRLYTFIGYIVAEEVFNIYLIFIYLKRMLMIIILLRIEQTLTVTVPIDSSRLIPPTLIIHSVALRNQMTQSSQKVNNMDIKYFI